MMSSEHGAPDVVIDVAYWNLTRHRHQLEECEQLLSHDERARAGRLALPFLRERFALGRGLLRLALARITDSDPAELRFERGPHGKPSLVGGVGTPPSFSVSRSDDDLLIATAPFGAIGCDLERIRPVPEAPAMVSQWFAVAEREALQRLHGAAFDHAFLAAWVRKEAALKAVGLGLQGSLAIDTGLAGPDGTRATVAVEGRRLWLADLDRGGGWVAAVSADRPFTIALSDQS